MSRSYLYLLLLALAVLPGCAQLVADTDRALEILPEKTPERPGDEPVTPVIDTSKVPPVLLSTRHAQWCTKLAGDSFPTVRLPRIPQGEETELASLYGSQATVVVLWTKDRWMSLMALEDIQQQVAATYAAENVAVVGIASSLSNNNARQTATAAGVAFPHLLDAEGTVLAELGSVALPRIYVLDPAGRILWFDIEYSESTRRELLQTLAAVAGKAS